MRKRQSNGKSKRDGLEDSDDTPILDPDRDLMTHIEVDLEVALTGREVGPMIDIEVDREAGIDMILEIRGDLLHTIENDLMGIENLKIGRTTNIHQEDLQEQALMIGIGEPRKVGHGDQSLLDIGDLLNIGGDLRIDLEDGLRHQKTDIALGHRKSEDIHPKVEIMTTTKIDLRALEDDQEVSKKIEDFHRAQIEVENARRVLSEVGKSQVSTEVENDLQVSRKVRIEVENAQSVWNELIALEDDQEVSKEIEDFHQAQIEVEDVQEVSIGIEETQVSTGIAKVLKKVPTEVENGQKAAKKTSHQIEIENPVSKNRQSKRNERNKRKRKIARNHQRNEKKQVKHRLQCRNQNQRRKKLKVTTILKKQ